MKKFFSLWCVLVLASCAHHREVGPPTVDTAYFTSQLDQMSRLQNAGQFDAVRPYFSKNAAVQSPVTPRRTTVEKYLQIAAADRYMIAFSNTEIVYSLPSKVTTRSTVRAAAPEKFNLTEPVMIDWRFEDGQWRISRFSFPDWPPVVGVWRRSGLRGEGTLELRILPGGNYVVYVNEDYTLPKFRGQYQLDGNRITLTDTSAEDPKMFEKGSGSYLFVRTAAGAEFRKVQDDSNWRSERFDGAWVAWQ